MTCRKVGITHVILAVMTFFSFVCSADVVKIQDFMKSKFPDVELQEINKIKNSNLYEIVVDGDILYVDSNMKYFFDGSLIDLATMQNITKARRVAIENDLVEKLTIPLEKFPLSWSLKLINGDGKREMAYFADPNCGYCRRFEKDVLPRLQNVTIHIFPYPIISQKSVPLTQSIWCSSDRMTAWNNYILRGKGPSNAGDCENPINDILQFGKRMRIRGTPTLFFVNGERVSGMMGLEDLNKKLDSLSF